MIPVSMPEGWFQTNLGNITEFTYGESLPERVRSGRGFPVYGSNGIIGHHDSALTKGETIIIGRKGSIGEVHYSPLPCFPIDTTYYIEQFHGMPAKFWFFLLKFSNLGNLNKATAIPGLNRNDAYGITISVAPLSEQKRIADKLDSLLSWVDSCQAHLDRIPQILKRFRQSVLAAATSGRLTEKRKDFHGEWRTCPLGEVITEIRYGTAKKSTYEIKNGTPVLRIPNVVNGRIDATDLKFTYFDKREIGTLSLKADDLLLIRSNGSVELVGRVAIVGPEFEGYMYAGYLIRLRFDTTKVNPRYISLYLSSPAIRNYIELTSRSTSGVNNINSEEVKAIPLELPLLDEQHEIVRRVEVLFAFADRLEARWQSAQVRVTQLTPSLLAKAFRGELVEQDPNDEPAEKLLKRIKVARD